MTSHSFPATGPSAGMREMRVVAAVTIFSRLLVPASSVLRRQHSLILAVLRKHVLPALGAIAVGRQILAIIAGSREIVRNFVPVSKLREEVRSVSLWRLLLGDATDAMGFSVVVGLRAFSMGLSKVPRTSDEFNFLCLLLVLALIQTVGFIASKIKGMIGLAPQPERLDDPVVVEVLHDPGTERIRADVIFIHGLNGSPSKTWTQGLPDRRSSTGIRRQLLKAYQLASEVAKEAKATNEDHLDRASDDTQVPSNEEELSKCWPQEWLPLDCPGVRVIALGYSTDPYLWRPVWVPKSSRVPMHARGREMMEKLTELGVGRHPIVWVAHSKGGLFVKQIIVDASENCDPLLEWTKGIMFYSVPHHGASLARIHIPWLLGQSVEIAEVKKDAPQIRELHERFLSLFHSDRLRAYVVSMVETLTTPLYFTYVRVVDEEAADPGVGEFYTVSTNHKYICKPISRNCVLYQQLTSLINRVA